MRIIGGEFRSRRLHTPRDDSVARPMPDRVKESLFGLLRGNCEGAAVFDAFAGTGAIGLEAISRGASRCVFVERDRQMLRILERNIADLGVQDRCEIVPGDALGPGALARCPRPVDLAFFDPPYPLVRDVAGWGRVRTQFGRVIDLLSGGGFAVLRTPWPFFQEAAPEPAVPGRREVPARPRPRGRHGRVPGEVVEVTVDEAGGRDLEEVLDEKIDRVERRRPPERIKGDLSFANAQGPETHVYHAMAVHLYMRRR